MQLNARGHLTKKLEKCSVVGKSDVAITWETSQAEEQVREDGPTVSKEFRRLRLNLAHASVNVLRRLFKQSVKQVEEADLKDVVGRCGRSEALQRVERPLISQWVPFIRAIRSVLIASDYL